MAQGVLARPRTRVAGGGAATATPDRLGQAAKWLGWATALGFLAMLYMALIYAPTERTQGPAQRIFYLHIGPAFITYLAYIVTAIASIGYLWKRSERMDQLARSSAEVGLLLNTILLVSGSIWARRSGGRGGRGMPA